MIDNRDFEPDGRAVGVAADAHPGVAPFLSGGGRIDLEEVVAAGDDLGHAHTVHDLGGYGASATEASELQVSQFASGVGALDDIVVTAPEEAHPRGGLAGFDDTPSGNGRERVELGAARFVAFFLGRLLVLD